MKKYGLVINMKKMRINSIYTFITLLALAFSCQKPEVVEVAPPTQNAEFRVGEEVTISFSALLPTEVETKAMGDDPFKADGTGDIKNLFLVFFDDNGMYVETKEAKILSSPSTSHTGHLYEREFEVTVTVTDEPRIIHFIANCPYEQIVYGHEASIIGNMYVEKDQDSGTPETAYWARVRVTDLLTEISDDTGRPQFVGESVRNAFTCVPLLRNFSQITVVETTKVQVPDGGTFEYEGFMLYNTINKGTVAPYNKKTGTFQSFVNANREKYSYDELSAAPHLYEGHALSAAALDQTLPIVNANTEDDNLKYKWYGPESTYGESAYIYERKISVKTANEALWNESPPHLIIKGLFNGKRCYYKVDLVYDVYTNGVVSDIEYYNILRNFKYQFTIVRVDSEGYDSVEKAINGTTSNNIAGSPTTSDFTNISDNESRLWVSHTNRILVDNNSITLYYRYQPDITKIGSYNNDLMHKGGSISIESVYDEYDYVDADTNSVDDMIVIEANPESHIESTIIKSINVATSDETTGEWVGYRRIDIGINTPDPNKVKEQTIRIRTGKATLSRMINYILRNKYQMVVECTPKVQRAIGEPVKIDIKLPKGLTETMFPLDLYIEVVNMSLSPNADDDSIPVEVGTSEVTGKPVFYYVKTIESKADYDRLMDDPSGNYEVLETYWYTNIADSASDIRVTNYYFENGNASFGNGVAFSDVKINDADDKLFRGVGETTSISFTLQEALGDDDEGVTVKLFGLQDKNGNVTLNNVRPTNNNLTITVKDLTTNTVEGDVYFTVEHKDYITESSQIVTRQAGNFSELKVGGDSQQVPYGVTKTSISFKLDADDPNPANRVIKVTYEGLIDDDKDKDGQNTWQMIDLSDYDGLDGNVVTVNNLFTANEKGNIRFTVEEVNGVYEKSTSVIFTRREREFTNVGIQESTVSATSEQPVTFKFTIPESEFIEDMEVDVNMEGLEAVSIGQQGEKDVLVPVATKAASNSYTYTPSKSGEHTLYLKTTENVAGECSVTISASGFAPDGDEVEQKTKQTIEATLTFDNTNKRTTITKNQEYRWTENDIEFIIKKNTSGENVRENVKPMRIYSGQKIIVSVPKGGVITSIEFDCNSNDYATTLRNSIGNSATVSQDKVTINLKATSYEFSNFTSQVRLDAITVTYDI